MFWGDFFLGGGMSGSDFVSRDRWLADFLRILHLQKVWVRAVRVWGSGFRYVDASNTPEM